MSPLTPLRQIEFCGCRHQAAGSKRKTPEQLADPVGLFGRSGRSLNFAEAFGDSSAEHFNPIALYMRAARQAKVFLSAALQVDKTPLN
jgi:hypothetical protein